MKTQQSIFKKLSYIQENGCMHLLLRFSEVTVFHCFMECLISVYLLELIAVLTKFFLKNPMDISAIWLFVFGPSVIILWGCAFSVVCIVYFFVRLYHYLKKINEKLKTHSDSDVFDVFDEVMRRYKREIGVFHIAGTICYAVSTYVIPKFLTKAFPELFLAPEHFVWSMFAVGVTLGFIWNLAGMARDQRINWSKIVPKFELCSEQMAQKNMRCLLENLAMNLVSILFLALTALFIMCFLHDKIRDSLDTFLTHYGFIIAAFAALCFYYGKKSFSYLYAAKGETDIYPGLEMIMSDVSANKTVPEPEQRNEQENYHAAEEQVKEEKT